MKPEVWDQLKNKSCDEIIRALLRDGWLLQKSRGALRTFKSTGGRKVTIHYHPQKNYGVKLLRDLLKDIGWSKDDLRRLKLVK